MWMLSLEMLLLAVLVFWGIGAWKRLKRLQHGCQQAFQPVLAQFAQLVDMMRSCARKQTLKEQVANVYAPHASQALLASANLLEAAVQQVHPGPQASLRADSVATLDMAWQSAQVAWQSYAQQCEGKSALHQEHVQEWQPKWQQLHTLQAHSMAQFNAAVEHYNRAIAQLPACAIARLGGYRAGRIFQKVAA